MRLLHPFVLLFLTPALPAIAQWHADHPELFQRFERRMQQSPADSADFARFGAAMSRSVPDSLAPSDLGAYRLVWVVTCEGTTWLQRGDSTDLPTFLKDPPEDRFGELVCCPRFYGGQYAVVHWEPPTGLVRFHYWFFERTQ